jgi:two-component system, OmpR family, phosphate regulon sensor histidine kinase PhoR
LYLLHFFVGLALGLAFWLLWQYLWRQRLNKLLRLLQQVKFVVPTGSKFNHLAAAITSQQQRYGALEQQIEIWQQVLEVAPLAYVQVNRVNQLMWINPEAVQLLGVDGRIDEPLGDAPQRRLLLQIVRSYELDQLIAQTRKAQQPKQREWVYHPPLSLQQGQPQQARPLRGYGFPLANGDIGVFLADRQEAQVLKAERDRWIADVAHELKTPLTSMRLVAETLQPRIEPRLQVWVDRLLQEMVRLGDLVQNLLELGRLSQDVSTELRLTEVDLPALIHNVWLSLEPLANQKRLQFCYQGPEALHATLDQSQFFRVLLNLLDNAIRYSPNQGKIQVHITTDASATPEPAAPQTARASLCLDVIDAGPGFSEIDLPHVFERFYRAEASRVRHPSPNPSNGSGGSGLGLAIVQQIVTAHQGRITAQNHPETGGGWLRIFLPLAPPVPFPELYLPPKHA